MQPYWRNLLRFTTITITLALLFLFFAIPARMAWSLTHPPRAPIDTTPTQYNLPYETISFAARDGVQLSGWWIRGTSRADRVVILVHGYRANKAMMLDYAAFLAHYGYSTLLFDLRGHGESADAPVTFAAREVNDVRGALDWLAARPQSREMQIVAWGQSLGAATVLRAAGEDTRIRAVIAESAFASLREQIDASFTAFTGLPAFPFAPMVVTMGEWMIGVNQDAVRPVDSVAHIAPRAVFIVHGARDPIMPLAGAHALYNAAREPKQLWILDDAAHGDIWFYHREEYAKRVLEFLERGM